LLYYPIHMWGISFCIKRESNWSQRYKLCLPLSWSHFIMDHIWRDRRCESPFETFFKDQCLPIRSIEDCPENMELYDGPNNEGFCDCHSDVKGNNSLRLIYWDETGKCYFQNTQVYRTRSV
jgi:hypothetical protein